MTLSLFNYQLEAVNKLRSGSILCGGVGSGKSLTSIYYYFVKNCEGSVYPKYRPMKNPIDLYIITTARKRDTLEWEKELINFNLNKGQNEDVKIVIDSWNNINKYIDVKNSFFILDEQRVVGSGTWVKSFVKISKFNKWILLSATPGDTWMDYVPVFVANGYYKNRTDFIRKHVVFDNFVKYPKIKRYVDTNILSEYRKSILITMDYNRLKKINNEKIEVNYDIDIYNTVTKHRWNPYESKPIDNVSELFYTWRKIVNSDKSRIDAIYNIFQSNKKLIIFYNFDYELETLQKFCENEAITYKEWNGHKHELIPKQSEWIYLVQYTAGAEGWNCIETNNIIFYSLNYSYKVMHQAAGRIDRLNSPFKILNYYYLYSKSKIDLAIMQSLKNKKSFNEKKFLLN